MSGRRALAVVEAAIFDLDGLLIDSEPLWQDAEMEVFGALGLDLDRDECRRTTGLRTDSVVAYWLARRPWDVRRFPAERIVERINRRVVELIGERAEPKDGVSHALDFVAARGLRAALASSSSMPVIEAALRRLDIAPRFEVVHSADFEARSKPHPDVYLGAAARLGVAPPRCVALEDSLPGVAAAKAAGMRCIRVPEPAAGDDGVADVGAAQRGGAEKGGRTPGVSDGAAAGAAADLELDSLARLDGAVWNNLLSLPIASPAS